MSTGQGVIGCNMFCYCLNNPVNMADESGTYCNSNLFNLTEYTDGFSRNEYNPNIRRKNPLKYLSDDIVLSPADSAYAERCKSFFNPPITAIVGVSVSGNLGFFSGSISIGIAFDQANYDSGIGFYFSGSLGGGTPALSGSIGGFMGVYDEPYRINLSGKGYQNGGSFSVGYFSISHDRCSNGCSTGVGVSFGKMPVEFHGQYTYTFVS